MDLNTLSRRVDQRTGERKAVEQAKKTLLASQAEALEQRGDLDAAQIILQEVARITQEALEFRISELVTVALNVFPEPYTFRLQFEAKRGQSEAKIVLLTPTGEELDPMSAVGGGVIDMVAFSLRIGLWVLRQPRPRGVIVLDEPFRFLSRGLQPEAGKLIKELSTKLGLQFIIVSHEEALVENVDKILTVRKAGGISRVEDSLQSSSPIPRRRRVD